MAVEYGSEHTCVRLQKAQHKSAGEFDDGVQTWSKKTTYWNDTGRKNNN